MSTDRVVLKAIHDTDLEKVLKKLGIYEAVSNGKYKCAICGRTITLKNLGGIFKTNGEIKLVCNDIRCLVKVAQMLSTETK